MGCWSAAEGLWPEVYTQCHGICTSGSQVRGVALQVKRSEIKATDGKGTGDDAEWALYDRASTKELEEAQARVVAREFARKKLEEKEEAKR